MSFKLDSEFQKYLTITLKRTLYNAGRYLYKDEVEGGPSDVAKSNDSKREFLNALDSLCDSLTRDAVNELEREGIDDPDLVLKNQTQVERIMSKYQRDLESQDQRTAEEIEEE